MSLCKFYKILNYSSLISEAKMVFNLWRITRPRQIYADKNVCVLHFTVLSCWQCIQFELHSRTCKKIKKNVLFEKNNLSSNNFKMYILNNYYKYFIEKPRVQIFKNVKIKKKLFSIYLKQRTKNIFIRVTDNAIFFCWNAR